MRDLNLMGGHKVTAAALGLYSEAASEISGRQLTDKSDILNAFAGIGNVLFNDINTPAYWGMPTAYFELALLWDAESPPLFRREGFPSWSWAGWHGRVAWKKNEMTYLLTWGTNFLSMIGDIWITWYRRDGSRPRPLNNPVERPNPEEISQKTWIKKLGAGFQSKIKSLVSPDYLGEQGEGLPSATALRLGDERLGAQLLHFWTVSASFRLSRKLPVKLEEHLDKFMYSRDEKRIHPHEALILDEHDSVCGRLTFTGGPAHWPDERLSGSSESPAFHELIVLCGMLGGYAYMRGSERESAGFPLPPYEGDHASFLDFEKEGSEDSSLGKMLQEVKKGLPYTAGYTVMLIERIDGIAYRAGLGVISKPALNHAPVEKEWKEIVLG